MRRRMFTHVVSVIAVTVALGLTQRCTAKPPDLPVNTENTVTPEFLPDSEWDGVTPLPTDREVKAAENALQWLYFSDDGQSRSVSLGEAIFIAMEYGMYGVNLMPSMDNATRLRIIRDPFMGHFLPVLRPQSFFVILFGEHPGLKVVANDGFVDLICNVAVAIPPDYVGILTDVEDHQIEIHRGGRVADDIYSEAGFGFPIYSEIRVIEYRGQKIEFVRTHKPRGFDENWMASCCGKWDALGLLPNLALAQTTDIVDQGSTECDNPYRAVLVNVQEDNSCSFIAAGLDGDRGVKLEIIPMPKETHGTIEIGIGFSLNGAPTYKCEVTEIWGCGSVHKDNTFQGCWDTLLRCLLHAADESAKPATNSTQALQCPWYQKQPESEQHFALPPSVRQNLENLAQAEELREKGRRLAEDGFSAAAKMCFDDARRLCPGCPSNQRGDADYLEAEEAPEIFLSGVSVMVDGLLKGCYLSLAVGRYGHAVDLARQAYALDPDRVAADPVVCNLHLLAKDPVHGAGYSVQKKSIGSCCDDCPGCPDCPCSPQAKPQKSNVLIDFIASTFAGPAHLAPLTDSGHREMQDGVLKAYDGEEQEPHVFQKAIAKPYRETNETPAGVGKGD